MHFARHISTARPNSLKVVVTFHILNAAKIYVSNASVELPNWFVPLATASFVLAFSVDCVTTCLLALKLTLTHRETSINAKPTENWRGFVYLRSAVSIFIDSGVPTVIAQLAVLRLYSLQSSWFQSASSPAAMISVRSCFFLPSDNLIYDIGPYDHRHHFPRRNGIIRFAPHLLSAIQHSPSSLHGHRSTER